MDTLRKPFQGVKNIVRFNWHFYLIAIGLAIALLSISFLSTALHPNYTVLPAFLILWVVLISLLVSMFVYDFSDLYSLKWLDEFSFEKSEVIANINAGFDETSELLKQKYLNAELLVLDFYNPQKHTEVSIKRARKAYPPYQGTLQISTDKIPLNNTSVDTVFAILSAHEIRDASERKLFFSVLKQALKPNGCIIVTEHLRDVPNFLAYTIGFFHFHSKNTWMKTFSEAGLIVSKEIKITPFITTFVLQNA